MSESNDHERCYKERAPDGPSLFQDGKLVIQTHHIGWIVASAFTLLATIISIWLVSMHLKWYTNKREQRHIVRILFMVPIYAMVSLTSYFFWNHATPIVLIRDGYESTVLTSFFYLLLIYLSPDSNEQRALFYRIGLSKHADKVALRENREPEKWMFPLGFVKWKPTDGLSYLQIMKWGVLQYCVLRPTTTLAAVILDYMGLYCESSWSPGWGHIYLVLIVSVSVTIAMYCLIQLYMNAKEYLAPQRPLLKLFAIKAVVFLTFWQATFLSVLSMFGVVKDSTYMTADDINIGIGALLETFEMMVFAILHIYAFTYKVYIPIHPPPSKNGLPSSSSYAHLPDLRYTSRWRALGHAMDFRETFRELWGGTKYMWAKMRGREPKVDVGPRRYAYYESAFGRPRVGGLVVPAPPPTASLLNEEEKGDADERGREGGRYKGEEDRETIRFPEDSVRVEVNRMVEVDGRGTRREWLGVGNYYGYGIYREKSDGLEEQIERELLRRGYGMGQNISSHIKAPKEDEEVGHAHPRQRSWWRSIYNRVSQSTDHDFDHDNRLSPSPSRNASRTRHESRSRNRSSKRASNRHSRERNPGDVERELLADYRNTMEDPPPQSLIRKYRASRQETPFQRPHDSDDYLSPLEVYHTSQIQKQQQQQQRKTSRGQRVVSPPSSPPPASLLLSPTSTGPEYSPQPYPNPLSVENDSLLGRIFPSRTNLSAGLGHTTDGFTTPIQASENGHVIGLAGERRAHQPINGVTPRSTEGEVVRPTEFQLQPLPATVSPPPPPHSPSSPRSPVSLPPSQPSRALRRSSAQVYSPHERPSHRHRQSMPTPSIPPQSHAHMPHLQTRRRSTPMILTIPAPLAPPPPMPRNPSSESTTAQPSYSGTPFSNKYPIAGSSSLIPLDSPVLEFRDYSRYPGMPPSPSTPSSSPRKDPSLLLSTPSPPRQSYTNHHMSPNSHDGHS